MLICRYLCMLGKHTGNCAVAQIELLQHSVLPWLHNWQRDQKVLHATVLLPLVDDSKPGSGYIR